MVLSAKSHAGTSTSRAKIVELVSLLPGIHLRELQRMLGVSFNSIRYNIEILSKSGEIVCEKSSGYSRLFPVGLSESDRVIYSALRNRTAKMIVLELERGQQLTNKELSERTGLAKSTISEHVHELLLSNIVHLTLTDGGFKVELCDPERVNEILTRQARENGIVESFTDLWDGL